MRLSSLLFLCAGELAAQSVVWTAAAPVEGFGRALACPGDLDLDGAEDFAIARNDALVELRSGRTGSILRTHLGPPYSGGMNVVALGDVDADGVGDYAIGSPGARDPSLRFSTNGTGWCGVLSGASGALIWQQYGAHGYEEFGGMMAAAGDLDGDGIPDLVVGAYQFAVPGGGRGSGRVVAYDGRTGRQLWILYGSNTPVLEGFGYIVASCRGDMNGDRRPDVLVVSTNPVSIRVLSGATGAELRYLPYTTAGLRDIDGLGDTDGDGIADYVVGVFDGAWESGAARVYSGATSALRYRVHFNNGHWTAFGGKVRALGDLTGDGIQDFGVGTRGQYVYTTWGFALVYDGANGTLLRCMDGSEQVGRNFGYDLTAGDADGDGQRDVLVSAPRYEGRVEVHGVLQGGAIRAHAPRCGPLCLSLAGQPRLGERLGVRAFSDRAAGGLFVGIGTIPLQLPLCGCTFGHEWGISLPAGTLWLPIPSDPLLVGADIGLQGLDALVSGGCASPQFALSETLFVTIGW